MRRFTRSLLVAGMSEALDAVRHRPLRALLAATAMAAAVATTAIVQTALDGLARAARDASARAFGSDSFVIAKVATGNVSRRELAQRLERNADITRADVRFLETVANDRVMYAAIAQRSTDVVAGGRRFENAAINGTQAALFDIRDVGLDIGRPLGGRGIHHEISRNHLEKTHVGARDVRITLELLSQLVPAQGAGRDLGDHEGIAAECARARGARLPCQSVQCRLHDGRRGDGGRHRKRGEKRAKRTVPNRGERFGDPCHDQVPGRWLHKSPVG